MNARLIGEMVRIALSAIWVNKLRSFLTILGNVVAVGSIVTLVSLIQGITDEVTNVILTQVSADTSLIERVGLTISDIDPRGARTACFALSDQARLVGAGVLEASLSWLNEQNA